MNNSQDHFKIVGLLFRGAGVKRAHCYHLTRERTVAEHTFRMLQLYFLLAKGTIGVKIDMVQAIVHHDLGECVTGDIPAPVKKVVEETTGNCPSLLDVMEEGYLNAIGYSPTELSEFEKSAIRLLDLLELMIMCWEEYYQHGNESVWDMHNMAMRFFFDKWRKTRDSIPATYNFNVEFLDNMHLLATKFEGETEGRRLFGSVGEFFE